METAVAEAALRALQIRIDNLETTVTYQDDLIEELNKVIVAQWSKFDQMQTRMDRLENRVTDQQDTAGPDRPDERPPPHY